MSENLLKYRKYVLETDPSYLFGSDVMHTTPLQPLKQKYWIRKKLKVPL